MALIFHKAFFFFFKFISTFARVCLSGAAWGTRLILNKAATHEPNGGMSSACCCVQWCLMARRVCLLSLNAFPTNTANVIFQLSDRKKRETLKVKSKTMEVLVAQRILMGALELFPGAAGPRIIFESYAEWVRTRGVIFFLVVLR